MASETPLLSICCITYNQEAYVQQALEGFAMQRVNFPIELVVHDDFSSDNTRQILSDFKNSASFPVTLLFADENKFSQGERIFLKTFQQARGTYIALCEGDDFWIDPFKLQKQVDFLEENREFNICFHRANLQTLGETKVHPIPISSTDGIYRFQDLLAYYNFITTASVVFRKPSPFTVPEWYHEVPFGDLATYKVISEKHPMKCLPDIMSVYRLHDASMHTGAGPLEQQKQYLKFYQIIYPYSTEQERQIIQKKKKQKIKKIAKLRYPGSILLRLFLKGYLSLIN